MAKSVTFEIDTDIGELTIASGTLFLGEQTPITFSGYTKAAGNTLRLTLFGKDGVTPLADNHASESTLDLRADILRRQFGGCRYTEGNPPSWNWTNENHGTMSFDASVIELDSTGANVGGVLSRGRITITWAPYVFNAATGSPATLKGDTGAQGERGETGRAANISVMKDEDGKWHDVCLTENEIGELVMSVDPEESEHGQPFAVQNETIYLNGIS